LLIGVLSWLQDDDSAKKNLDASGGDDKRDSKAKKVLQGSTTFYCTVYICRIDFADCWCYKQTSTVSKFLCFCLLKGLLFYLYLHVAMILLKRQFLCTGKAFCLQTNNYYF
jgi:hypothetical protein